MAELPADSTATSNSSDSVVENNNNNSAAVDPPPDPSHNAAASSTGYNDGATLGVSAAGGASGGINVPHSMSIMSPVGSSPVPQAATVASEPPVRATDGTTSSDSSLVPAVPPLSGSLAEVAGALPPSSTNSAPTVLDGLGPRQAAAPAANGAELNDSHHSVFDAGQAEGGRGSLQTSVQRSASLEGVGGSEAEGRTAMAQRSSSDVQIDRGSLKRRLWNEYGSAVSRYRDTPGDGSRGLLARDLERVLSEEIPTTRAEHAWYSDVGNVCFVHGCVAIISLLTSTTSDMTTLLSALRTFLLGKLTVRRHGQEKRTIYAYFRSMEICKKFTNGTYLHDSRFSHLARLNIAVEQLTAFSLEDFSFEKYTSLILFNMLPTENRDILLNMIEPWAGEACLRDEFTWTLNFKSVENADAFARCINRLSICGTILTVMNPPSDE